MYFTFTESARKDVKKLPPDQARHLKAKLQYWQASPDPLVFAKPLQAHEAATHRFRFGAYRVLVQAKGSELRVLRIRNRKDVYRLDG